MRLCHPILTPFTSRQMAPVTGIRAGRSGCAAIVHYPDHLDREDEQIVDFGCDESSNNRMELMACIRVLKWIRESGPWKNVTRVQIFTDSQYVKDSWFAREGGKRTIGGTGTMSRERMPTLEPIDFGALQSRNHGSF